MKISSSDMALPRGTSAGNKSGYTATFIGRSPLAGWPIPCHIQTKSTALPENQKISIDWLRNTQNVRGVYGFGKVVKRGIGGS